MIDTKAGRALVAALTRDPSKPRAERMTQAELARRLGVAQPSVSAWVRMIARPEAHHRKGITRELGIPEDDWFLPEERAAAFGKSDSDAGNDAAE